VAEEVVSSGRAKALEPMSAADRKVVHDAVGEIDGVQTSSRAKNLPVAW
jgi:spoIIIJ-associated protein